MRHIYWKYWEIKRWKFNLLTILGGIVCLIISRMLNSASVNFFMLTLVISHLLLLNIMYTITYLIYDYTRKDSNRNPGRVFRILVFIALGTDVLAAMLAVILIPHR